MQIAAGEVIDRPVSVVRELVDNAIDAGSDKIEIELEQGGIDLIRVSDNGCGIPVASLERALERHATSKIRALSDLLTLKSRGFRGEALAAIKAVSRLSITSRYLDFEGATLSSSPTEPVSITPAARSCGTCVEVRNLFYNVPVRRKFFKSQRVECDRVYRYLQGCALALPQVLFKLINDGREVLFLSKREDQFTRGSELFGGVTFRVNYEQLGVKVLGMLGAPSESRRKLNAFFILVNERVVSDGVIYKAVKEGYGTMLRPTEQPVGFIAVTVDSALVDYNVHPQKAEVRFVDSGAIFQCVRNGVKDALRFLEPRKELFPELTINKFEGSTAPSIPVDKAREDSGQKNTLYEERFFRSLKVLGVHDGNFLLASKGSALYLLDIHALHERVNFNKIKDSFYKSSHNPSQYRLKSMTLTFGERDSRFIAVTEALTRFGFEFKIHDEELEVVAVPSFFIECSNDDEILATLKDLLDTGTLEEGGRPEVGRLEGGKLEVMVEKIAARLACHQSKRGGEYISEGSIAALLSDLDKEEQAQFCPHGRPTFVELDGKTLAKLFLRDK